MVKVSRLMVFSTRELPEHVQGRLAEGGVHLDSAKGPATSEQLRDAIEQYDGILITVSERIDASVLETPTRRTRVISNIATGTDNIDLVAAARSGVTITRVPAEVTSRATAELTLLLMLMAARRPDIAHADILLDRWHQWMPYQWAGRELAGATLGLLGFGAIGRTVGEYATALGMRVQFHQRTAAPALPWSTQTNLETLLRTSEVLSIHVPLTPSTRGMIARPELDQLPSGAIVVNTARGGILDEVALLEALDRGQVATAGIDVYDTEPARRDHPLVKHPGVVTLPHIGSATQQTRDAMVDSAARSCLSALLGEPLPPSVLAAAPTARAAQ